MTKMTRMKALAFTSAACAAACIFGCGGSKKSSPNSASEPPAGARTAGGASQAVRDASGQDNHNRNYNHIPDRVLKYREDTTGVTYWYDTKHNFFGEWRFSGDQYRLFPFAVIAFPALIQNTAEAYRYYYDSECLKELDWVGAAPPPAYIQFFNLFNFIDQNNRNGNLAKAGNEYCFVKPDSARKVYVKYMATGKCDVYSSTSLVGFLKADMSDCFGEEDMASYAPHFEQAFP